MTGFSFIGILFADVEKWFDILLFSKTAAFILFYVMSVFFLNSYADYEYDIQSERLQDNSIIPRSRYFYLLLASTVVFSILSFSINTTVFLITISSLLLWVLYYTKPVHLKARFLGGTFAHFLGGILHFHMGYGSFSSPGEHSLIVSVFFALLLCMGHANHEILDFDSDKKSGIRTTAVRIGLDNIHYVRSGFAVASLVHLIVLFYTEHIHTFTMFIFLLPVAILVISSFLLEEKNPKTFLKISRYTIFVAGLALIAVRLIEG